MSDSMVTMKSTKIINLQIILETLVCR